MKCPKCGSDNRRAAKFCGECGAVLAGSAAPEAVKAAAKPAPREGPRADAAASLWSPDWRWHLKALLAIYAVLAVLYFVVGQFLSRVPEPYRMRDIPPEMTPWLKH